MHAGTPAPSGSPARGSDRRERGRRLQSAATLFLALGLASLAVAETETSPSALYQAYCASCHGADRYGGYAPPLYAEALARKKSDALVQGILEGLPNTQMPAFGDRLDEAAAKALVEFVQRPLPEVTWGVDAIAASRVEEEPGTDRISKSIRRDALILVVERATGSISVLDGDRLSELDRFPVGRIHGGPKFDRDLHRVYAVTRDGTVVEYDLDRFALRTRVKVGVNSRNIAVSPDGTFVAAANQLPRSLVVMDGQLRPVRSIPLSAQPSGVYFVPGKQSVPGQQRFILGFRDEPKLLIVSLPNLELRWVELPEPFEDFTLVPGRNQVVASSRKGERLLLYDLVSERVLGTLPTSGLPHLFSACFFDEGGALRAAFNHIGVPRLSIVDMESFEILREIPLKGSGYFVRTHEATPYLWVDSNTEEIELVEKSTLRLLERTLHPAPGKKAMHVEFTADGDKALVSVWHVDGAVVVYDSTTLAEVARLPYAMPVGKYNARNRTRDLHAAEARSESASD
ncbi:MAG: hypothetical protein GY937_01795 [bacterium]|nr:hypothetical protein [bacterium]